MTFALLLISYNKSHIMTFSRKTGSKYRKLTFKSFSFFFFCNMVKSPSTADVISINTGAAAEHIAVFLINPSGLSFQRNAVVELHYWQSLDTN